MKLGLNLEYTINLGNSFFSYTGTGIIPRNFGLSAQWDYTGSLFVAPYNMGVNRVAFPVVTSSVSLLTAGITTVDGFGYPNGQSTATSLTFLSSAGISSTVSGQYAVVTIPDVRLTQNTPYFVAVQVKTFTSVVNLRTSTVLNSHAAFVDFPYMVERNGATAIKVGFFPEMLYGFNNGSVTQWYGMPNGGNSQTVPLNQANLGYDAVGAKIFIPSTIDNFTLKAVGVDLQKTAAHGLVLQIFESDNATQVKNATSVINANYSPINTRGHYYFQFGAYPVLRSYATYYIRIFGTGPLSANTNIFCQRLDGTGLTTSAVINSQFHTAYDITNRFYRYGTSGGIVQYNEFDNVRLNAWLVCKNFNSSFRGTKENGYRPGF